MKTKSVYHETAIATRAKELIAHMLREKNMNGSDLARLLGTSRANINCLLKGRSRMNLSTLARTAHALGYSVHFTLKPLEPRKTDESHAP